MNHNKENNSTLQNQKPTLLPKIETKLKRENINH